MMKERGYKATFELDQHNEQQCKRKHLTAARIDQTGIEFIAINFEQPDWIKALTSSSYDPALKSIFLWEGVSLYLNKKAVCDTLKALKTNTAPGSVVIADLYSTRFVNTLGKQASKLLEMTDEQFNFGLDFSQDAEANLRRFIEAQGLKLGHHQFLGSAGVIAEILI